MTQYPPQQLKAMINNSYAPKRHPIAVQAWFPTGTESKPKIMMIKIKDPDGDITTIRQITLLSHEYVNRFGAGIYCCRCEIPLQNRKREVEILFFPHDLRWELEFIN